MVNKLTGDEKGYELMLIMSPNLSEGETEDALSSVKSLIEELGGSIFSQDIWGIREMAFNIKNCDKGYYAVYYINFENGEKIKELENALTIQSSVLRSLIMKISKHHIIKTHEEYDADAAIEDEEEKKLKEEKEKENPSRPPRRTPERKPAETKTYEKKTYEKKAVKAEAPVETKPEIKEVKVEKTTEKESKEALTAVDEKLKSLIDDPDISL